MRKSYDKENGRSMIEMLGVLAIIGVLSVGGIAGYSKAMYRYRLNKTIEEITYSAGAVRSFFAPQKNYNGLGTSCYNNNGGCTIYRKAKLVQDDMFGEYINGSGQIIQGGTANPFGGQFQIGAAAKIDDSACRANPICNRQAFEIYLTNIPQEACIDLITQDWSDAGVSMIRITKYEVLAHPNTYYIVPQAGIDLAVKFCEALPSAMAKTEILFYFDIDTTQGDYKTYIDETKTVLNSI